MILDHKSVRVFAHYQQFYLWDKGMTQLAPTDYSEEDVERRIKTAPHVVVTQPESNIEVAMEIEIHDGESAYEAEKWDHIAEASLDLPTGQLLVHECTGAPVADFQVSKGWFRVRSFHSGLDSYYDGKGYGGDSYHLVLWPAPPAEVRVLKQYSRPK